MWLLGKSEDPEIKTLMSKDPRVTVLIRSYKRPQAVAELLAAVLDQEHDSFEVVVVEQTPEFTEEERMRLEPLWADERVRLLRYEPLGGARARNTGIREARGEIIILIDDDDLPVGRHWIAGHEAHYADPNLAGLSARQVRVPGEGSPYPDSMRPLIRRLAMQFSPLQVPHISLPRFDEDLAPVDWVNGTNGSVRREVALRAGLWDESVRALEEHSFGFKFARVKKPGEYLAWKSSPTIVRRVDVRGGMDKRNGDIRKELETQLNFTHRIVKRYHPERFSRLYPLYLASAFVRTMAFVWDPDWFQDSLGERLQRTGEFLKMYPEVVQKVRSGS